MAIVLQLQNAEKHYGEQVLLDRASTSLTDTDRVGLIGRNGTGKSTICRILLDEEELDAGEVVKHRSLRLGYLRQHDPFKPGETVVNFLMRDTGQPDWHCGQVAWQFRISDAMLNAPVSELSGGWQTRVKLASLLLAEPNLIILDEPTNFLDLRTQMLLEDFLKSWRGGALIVSHDRQFLKNTCTHTLELARGKLTMFPGDVETYLEHREEQREHDRRVNASLDTKRKQLETFIAKNRAQANTASQARSKSKQLARINEQVREIETEEPEVNLRLPQVEPRTGSCLRCEDLAIGYPEHTVAEGIQLDFDHGTRIGVVGDNGQGKTTLLRTLVGSLKPIEGEVSWGYGCDIGVYAQHVYSTLPKKQTVQEYLEREAAPGTTNQTVLDVAGSFLFSGVAVEKKIGVLSGGERARLVLAGLLLSKNNVLLLDEPGNHLDVETLDALAEAMEQFQGTLVFTSHNRVFMRRVATDVVEVRDGRAVLYPGSYEEYVYRVHKELEEGERDAVEATTSAEPADRSTHQKVDGRKQHEQQKRLSAIERKIARLDEQKTKLNKKLVSTADPAEAEKIHEEFSQVTGEIESLEVEWCELSEALE